MGLSIGALLIRLHLDQTPEQTFVKPPLAASVLGLAPWVLGLAPYRYAYIWLFGLALSRYEGLGYSS